MAVLRLCHSFIIEIAAMYIRPQYFLSVEGFSIN